MRACISAAVFADLILNFYLEHPHHAMINLVGEMCAFTLGINYFWGNSGDHSECLYLLRVSEITEIMILDNLVTGYYLI